MLPELSESTLETKKRAEDYVRRAKEASNQWHVGMERWRNLYDQNHYKNVEKRPHEYLYNDPTPTNIVDLSVGILLVNEIAWHAVGWQPSPSEVADTSHIEKYLNGLVHINNERQGIYIPYEVDMHFARDGAAVLYSVWNNEIATTSFAVVQMPRQMPNGETVIQPIGVYREPPITTEVVDPLQIFLIPGGPKRWSGAVRIIKKKVYDVESVYGVRLYPNLNEHQKKEQEGELRDIWVFVKKPVPLIGPDGLPRFNEVLAQPETVQKWIVEHALLFDNEVIWPFSEAAGYDDLPFSVAFFKPVYRDDSKGWGHGIIQPTETTLALMERLVNRRTTQIDLYTALPLFTRSETNRPVKVDAVFGEAIPLGPNDAIEFVTWPGNAPDLQQHLSFSQARLQQSGFSDVMFSAGPNQVAGYALSQLMDQNRIRLEQPVKHLEQLWASWAKKVLHLTAYFAKGAVVRVYGRLRGKDFAEQIVTEGFDEYLVQARIKTKFPNDEVRKTAMATQLRPILSLHRIYEEYIDVEQPDDEYDRRLLEMAQSHPLMLQYGAIAALQELAKDGDQAALMTLLLMMRQGVGQQGPGRPQEPQQPEQLTGTAGPLGQPPPQAAGAPPPGQSEQDQLRALTEAAPGMTE